MAKGKSGLAEIEASYRAGLQLLKAELMSELASVDAKLRALGGGTEKAAKARKAPVQKPRGRSGKPLRAYVEEALSKAGKAMKVREIEAAVREAGYETKAKMFYHCLYTLLRQDPGFRKAGRGKFALKKNVG